MKKILLAAAFLWPIRPAFADPLVWETPAGTFGLPFTATEAVLGYGAISRQSIAGASLPVYHTPKDLVILNIGAVAPWPTNGATIEPYIAAGHDFLREIPVLQNYKSAHLNIFGRYIASNGKPDVGVSASYAPGGSVDSPIAAASARPLMPIASSLSLYPRHFAI